ncbi:MAG: hypothetical protein DRI88_13405, partial [Bacteroidetes bacterium]
VTFDYKLPVYMENAVFRISNMKGEIKTTFNIDDRQGQIVWDIRHIEKGVYIYTLTTGSLNKSGKLIVR